MNDNHSLKFDETRNVLKTYLAQNQWKGGVKPVWGLKNVQRIDRVLVSPTKVKEAK